LYRLVEKAPEIIISLIKGIIGSLGMFIQTGLDIIDAIRDSLGDLPNKAIQWGKDMIQGLINGIKSMIGSVGKAASSVADAISNFLHFTKPDEGPLREYETWMPDFIKGLAKSMEKSSYILEDATLDLANDMSNSILGNTSKALRGLKSGISTSLNPTINPSIAYDLNYQLMANAMKEALQEVDVELDDRAVGRFIDKQVSEEVYS
jgi:phage-related protein